MRRSSNNGFTLLELLIVITILAFMTTLVGVNLHGRERGDVDSVARILMTDLRYLRSRAMVNNIDMEMAFDVSDNSYVSHQAKIDRALPAAVSIRLTVDAREIAGSRARIVFYPDGSSSGGEIHLSNKGRELEVATSWLNGYVTLR